MRSEPTRTKRVQAGRSVFGYIFLRALLVLLLFLGLGVAATVTTWRLAGEARTLSENHLPILQAASRLLLDAVAMNDLATRFLVTETPSELASMADRAFSRARAVEDSLSALDALGLNGEVVARVRANHTEAVTSLHNLYTLSELLLRDPEAQGNWRLEDRRRNLVQRQEVLGSETITLISTLIVQAEQAMWAHEHRSTRLGLMMVVGYGVATVLAALILATLYRGFRNRILSRLLALKETMDGWQSHHRPDLLVRSGSGPAGDELDAMAQSLEALIVAVDAKTGHLEKLALRDPLTGLLNRRAFGPRFHEEVARARRHGGSLCLLVGDIDHFKRINDTYGHQAGDLALQQVATLWQAALREIDVCARLGGEEFVALLPETPLERGAEVAERLRQKVRTAPVDLGGGQIVTLTISIGLAAFHSGENEADLFARADAALYDAKNNGRDRVMAA